MSSPGPVLGVVARRTLALPVLPLMAALAWFAGRAMPAGWAGSWYAASAHMGSIVVVVAPLAAAVAAWEAGRGRRTGFAVLSATGVRSPVAVGALTVAVVSGYGAAAYLVGVLAAALLVVGGGPPSLGLLGLGLVGLFTATSLGYVVGHLLHRVFAAPLVAVATYLWLVLVSQWRPEWLARLSFLDDGCCSANVRVNPATLAGQFAWLAGLLAVSAALLVWRGEARRWQRAASALLATALLGGGLAILVATGGRLTVTRPPAEAACQEGQQVRVCVWPEHRYQLAALVPAADGALGPFRTVSDVPRQVVEVGLEKRAAPGGALVIGLPAEAAPPSMLAPLVLQALLPPPPPCARQNGTVRPFPGLAVRPYLSAWLVLRGQPTVPVAELVPPALQGGLQRLLAASPDQQLAWFAAARAAQADCTTPAPPLP